jgi:hypothetical protein
MKGKMISKGATDEALLLYMNSSKIYVIGCRCGKAAANIQKDGQRFLSKK